MKKIILTISILSVCLAASCSSTRITSSWREPDKSVDIGHLSKVLVVALLNSESNRHKAEEQMAKYLQGKGVVSYKYLNYSFNENDEAALRATIKADGFDGAITMRLLDVEKEITYTPGSIATYPRYYRTFGGYYIRSWQYFSTPGSYSTTRRFTIETNVYSIKEDRIIWTGLTESTNPQGVARMMEEITEVVYDTMVSEGFISK